MLKNPILPQMQIQGLPVRGSRSTGHLILGKDKRSTVLSASLVNEPVDTMKTADAEGSQLLEEMFGHVNGGGIAAHALVNNRGGSGDAVILDGDCFAAVALVHQCHGQCEDILDIAVIGSVAETGVGHGRGCLVVGTVTNAGGYLVAHAIVTATSGAPRGR